MVKAASTTPVQGAASGRATAQHAPVLASASANPLGDLQALAQVNQRLARSLRGLFEPLLRQAVKVSAEPIAVERFDAYQSSRGQALSSVTMIGMAPLSGQAMLVLDGALTFRLVDLYFGGPGLPPNPLPAEFTPTAEAMIARIAAGFAERLSGAWGELAEIAFQPGRTEANPAMLSHIDGEDRVVRTRFVLTVGEARPIEIDLLYPAASLKPIAAILSSKVQSRRQAADPAWTNNLARAVMQVKLPVRSVLAEPVIPLAQLMTLKPGDIIPISFGPEIPLLVSNNRFARGAVGASNGRAAIRVHRIEPLEDEDS
ncbi:flagellar motor switch protein FliM [Sphingomonas sp. MAH-20]|uniref:Flagellar motor switch protein FliM n=1 Tax=Sphingomonas horti TaxID=2682842 RepID=A0A6I4J306_9SPHN|nr:MULTISPECIES: FliM/FliN family flagellar motor switch protein [Sphingomonas]MBA2918976.1 FliM/FliN family flagellar motor switch protein [Sphingomonas sp. CGMCC 1.13658]MVO79009.1 flagellar motor switch protein FliM [Sphingomonas horti]